MRIDRSFLIVFFVFSCFSCEISTHKFSRQIRFLDIDDAAMLGIGTQNLESRDAGMGRKKHSLIKIKEDGGVEPVMAHSGSGMPHPVSTLSFAGGKQLELREYYDVSDSYFLLRYEQLLDYQSEGMSGPQWLVVVRKADGKAVELGSLIQFETSIGEINLFSVGSPDRFLIRAGSSNLFEVIVDSEMELSVSVYQSDLVFQNMLIDSDHNIYSFPMRDEGKSQPGEVVTATGSVNWLKPSIGFFVTENGEVCLVQYSNRLDSLHYQLNIEICNITADGILSYKSISKKTFDSQRFAFYEGEDALWFQGTDYHDGESTTLIYRISRKDGELSEFKIPYSLEFSSSEVVFFEDYIFLSGNQSPDNDYPGLFKVNLKTGELVQLLTKYQIFSFILDSEYSINFSALRYSDGKKVVGRLDAVDLIPATREPIILDEQLGLEINTLVRIR